MSATKLKNPELLISAQQNNTDNLGIGTFDDLDVFILANRFSMPELRHELRQAEIKAKVAEQYADTQYQTRIDLFPWLDYAAACHEALTWQKETGVKHHPKKLRHHQNAEIIKSKSDILATIEQYTQLRKSGKNFTGCCPIHQEKHPSLTVYPDRQTWHCYGCNRGGDVISFIQAVENTDFQGALAILEGM